MGDRIEDLTFLNRFDIIHLEQLFEMINATVTRGNGMKLIVR